MLQNLLRTSHNFLLLIPIIYTLYAFLSRPHLKPHGQKILKLRCDIGGKYSNKEFQSFCKEEDIIMDYRVPYTPQQNGTAERMNRILTEKMRAMISESKIPKDMWAEIIMKATYLLNRSPTTKLSKTPAEIWYN